MCDESSGYPNVLIVVIDCLRADRCRVDEGALPLKFWPGLAGQGTTFSQMIATAAATPACFGSLLTGQYPFVHGVRYIRSTNSLNPNLPTLPGLLKQAGYTTYARLTGPLIPILGLNRDFDDYKHRLKTETIYTNWGDRLFDEFRRSALREPWFVLLHLFELHRPRQMKGLRRPRSKKLIYDLAWQQLDAKLAGLMEHVPQNTIIIMTADHGEFYYRRSDLTLLGKVYRKLRENFNRPRLIDDWKGHAFHVYDELVHVPCCISGPGIPQGRIVNDQVRQIDLMPTVLELIGQKCPGPMHGRSIVPLVQGRTLEEAAAYVESGCDEAGPYWHGLRSGGWKYAEHPRSSQNVKLKPMLFNLKEDPWEMNNVAHEHPDFVARAHAQEIDELIHLHLAGTAPANSPLSEENQAELSKHLRALGYL